MVEFAKSRGFLGYGVSPGGRNDKDSSHAVLPLAEYDELLRRIAVAERDKHEAIEQAKRTIGRERAAAEQRVREAEEAAQEQVTAMEEKLTRAEKEVNYQKGLNANLLRISRERANADRSLRPKKEHTGYAVVRSMEKEYRYKISRHSWGKVMLWETVIQSPYSMEFTEEQARKQIRRELLRDKTGGDWLIGKVGIRVSCDLEFEDMIQYSEWWEKNKDENIMMKRKLNLNGRSGYWEVVFYHTRPLGPVPEEMRPCVR